MSLIGISGKIGSGKDEIGTIIQYLSCLDKDKLADHQKDYGEFKRCPISNEIYSGWKIKKYADKLKEIVCLLIGCTRDQLEDREFKNTPLGKEWDYYSITYSYPDAEPWIKHKLDNILKSRNIYTSILLAEEDIHNLIYHEDRVNTSNVQFGIELNHLTPRKLFKLLGTECCRNLIHPNIWVNALFSNYTSDKNWVITDVRFPNEAAVIKEKGGILIRVNRPCINTTDIHESEIALDDYPHFDYIIENNGTIEDLIQKINKLKIV